MSTLKASPEGIARIKQARREKGWSVDDFRWIESASDLLGVSWQESGFLASGISEGTWKRFLAGKYPINAEAFQAYCQILGIDWEKVVAPQVEKAKKIKEKRQCMANWSQSPDVSLFYGRDRELEILRQWANRENCRLITLLGMGGIGKTTLSVRLGQEVVGEAFSCGIWRSLRNAPPVTELVGEAIHFLSQQQESSLSEDLNARISLLLKYLHSSRCLLILDNAESILQPGDRSGRYRLGCEGYGELLRAIAESPHQSCCIVTSREKPQGLAKYEGESLPVRSLQLTGLPETEGRKLFAVKGEFSASPQHWQVLISRYGGNPLALNIVASSIRDFFQGNIPQFLELTRQGAFIFDDIRDLIDEQFNRLTAREREIMYWLAIDREAVSLSDLSADFLGNIDRRELIESLHSLQRRSLIETSGAGFSQQPVVMEYGSDRLVEEVCAEIESGKYQLFVTHALIKAQSKDYLREAQIKAILQPLIDRLIAKFGSAQKAGDRLVQSLASLKDKSQPEIGYAGGNTLNLLIQAKLDLTGSDFSNLTIWEAYLQGVSLHDVNFANSDLSRCAFTEILGNILSAAFSPDGQLLATCDTDCHVRLWEVKTGKLLLICQGHLTWVRFVAFSPDGKILASCAADRTIKLWNVRDGVCIKTLTGHDGEVFSVAFHPNGQILASASSDLSVKLWDLATGACIETLARHTDWVRCVTFSPDGKILASSGADCKICIWEVNGGKHLKTLANHTGWVRSVAFSPDGEILASGSDDGTIKIWDYQTGECLNAYTGHGKGVYSIAYNPNGGILASGSSDRTIKIWDCQTDECIRTLHGYTNEVCAVAFSMDGSTLVGVSLDQTTRLWDARTGQCWKTWYSHTDWAFPVAFSPSGQFLATGSNDRTVKVWDWQAGNCIKSLTGHTDFVYGITFSPDGEILASASTDLSARLWHPTSGKCFQLLLGHTDWVFAVAFCPQGQILASSSADCSLKLWNLGTGQCLQTLKGHSDKIWGLTWSPDGQIVASASVDGSVKLWDIGTGRCLQTLKLEKGRVFSASFSPDGRIVAIASSNGKVELWDWQAGKCLQALVGHNNWVFSAAFSPDGETIASASYDRTIKIWDAKTGECRHTCTGHGHLVSSVAFHPQGHLVASGSQDQSARIWDANTGKCLKTLRAKRLYEGTNIAGAKGLTDATIFTLKSLGAIENNGI